jgi:hypothetical protein
VIATDPGTITRVHGVEFSSPKTQVVTVGAKNKFEANANTMDYLFRSHSTQEFDHVLGEDVACKIWENLTVSHGGDSQIKASLFSSYQREYQHFTLLPGKLIDAMVQRFTSTVNNMKANITILLYNDMI